MIKYTPYLLQRVHPSLPCAAGNGDKFERGKDIHVPGVVIRVNTSEEASPDLQHPVFSACTRPIVLWQRCVQCVQWPLRRCIVAPSAPSQPMETIESGAPPLARDLEQLPAWPHVTRTPITQAWPQASPCASPFLNQTHPLAMQTAHAVGCTMWAKCLRVALCACGWSFAART